MPTSEGPTTSEEPATLKRTLRTDLTAAIKSRDDVRSATLRMAMTAITNEEVSGKQARELSDDEVVAVLGREAKKRREAATAYDDAGRADLADRERAELEVLSRYLPQPLADEDLAPIIEAAIAMVRADGLDGGAAMGAVMRIVQPQVKGRADGSTVAARVRSGLGL